MHLLHKGHTYTKTETQDLAYGEDVHQPTSDTSLTRETVTVTFEIVGGDRFIRKHGRSRQVLQPKLLRAQFTSYNGEPWRAPRQMEMIVINVKKDGSLGAEVEVYWCDCPDWANVLVEAEDGYAQGWIRARYPR